MKTSKLFVGKLAAVVHNLHAVASIAGLPGAFRGFLDTSAINVDLDSVVANGALEEGYVCLWRGFSQD